MNDRVTARDIAAICIFAIGLLLLQTLPEKAQSKSTVEEVNKSATWVPLGSPNNKAFRLR